MLEGTLNLQGIPTRTPILVNSTMQIDYLTDISFMHDLASAITLCVFCRVVNLNVPSSNLEITTNPFPFFTVGERMLAQSEWTKKSYLWYLLYEKVDCFISESETVVPVLTLIILLQFSPFIVGSQGTKKFVLYIHTPLYPNQRKVPISYLPLIIVPHYYTSNAVGWQSASGRGISIFCFSKFWRRLCNIIVQGK